MPFTALTLREGCDLGSPEAGWLHIRRKGNVLSSTKKSNYSVPWVTIMKSLHSGTCTEKFLKTHFRPHVPKSIKRMRLMHLRSFMGYVHHYSDHSRTAQNSEEPFVHPIHAVLLNMIFLYYCWYIDSGHTLMGFFLGVFVLDCRIMSSDESGE